MPIRNVHAIAIGISNRCAILKLDPHIAIPALLWHMDCCRFPPYIHCFVRMSGMSTDVLVDTFELQIKLTHAIMLAILNYGYFGRDSHAFVEAIDDAVQRTFGVDYSYGMVSRTHKITNVATGVINGKSYLTLSFERC